MAVGMVGLHPEALRRMTPREIQWRIDAHFHHFKVKKELLAEHATWVTAPHLKKPLKVRDLVRWVMPGQKPKAEA